MIRIALTGGIATGKSHVRHRFESLGIPTIDADALSREAVAPGTPGLDAVVARFGSSILDAEGRIDRARLGTVVFSDDRARRDLEAIVHPPVYAEIRAWFERIEQEGARLGVADIPLLFETGAESTFDVVLVAHCPSDLQLERLRARDGLSLEVARGRIATQWPIDEKARRADYVVHTDGSFEQTNAQVDAVAASLTSRAT